jgi:drug/metabolite transporter (DMT)-like permease
LYAVSIKNVTALESKLIYNARPILAAILVFIFIGEKPGRYAIVGGAIVLSVISLRAIISVRALRASSSKA